MEKLHEINTYRIYQSNKKEINIKLEVTKNPNNIIDNQILIIRRDEINSYFLIIKNDKELDAIINSLNEIKEELWPIQKK